MIFISANDQKSMHTSCDFFISTMHDPEGWVHCDVKNQKTSTLIFAICTSTKSYQSLTSFIHVTHINITSYIIFKCPMEF